MRRPAAASLVLLAAAVGAPAVAAQGPERVFVVNLPEVQSIDGAVTLKAPPPQARLVRFAEVVVAPVPPDETTALVAGGVLRAEGFVGAVLSLAGQMRADHFSAGAVGALLIPDEEPIVEAFEEGGKALLPLRVEARVDSGSGVHFASDQPTHRLGFPRYRVYFHNTSDRPAAVTLYAYLVN